MQGPRTMTIGQNDLKKDASPHHRILSLAEKVMGRASIVGGIAALVAILLLAIRWVFA